MSYGRRVRVGARVRVGVQGVDVCLRPGRWCVKYRQARRRLGIRAGAVAVAVAVAAAAVTYESPSVACDAHTLPRLSRMCARCESRRAGQGEGRTGREQDGKKEGDRATTRNKERRGEVATDGK